MLVLMVTSTQKDLLGIFELKSKEKADNLKTICTFVNVVSQEEVVEGMNVSSITRSLPDIEESHQVDVLTMNISNDFSRWPNVFDDNRLGCQKLSTFVCKFNDVLSFARELRLWLNVLAISWF